MPSQSEKIGQKFLITKGADSVITALLREGQQDVLSKTNEYVNKFADQGLRTLFLAKKEIDEVFY